MNRLFKYSVFLFFLFQLLLSDIVEMNTIFELGDNFINKQNKTNTDYNISHIETIKKDGEIRMYLAVLEPSGFILFSSDNRMQPILGFSLNSNLDIDNIPHHMQILLNGYHKQIEYVIENNIPRSGYIESLWFKYSDGNHLERSNISAVEPLITTEWNQTGGYNDDCPSDGGADALVGCVAVSMAQIMKYWEYPIKGTGTIQYYQAPYGSIYLELGQEYNYNNMHTNNATDESSLLLYHCGVSVEMQYGEESSGAFVGFNAPGYDEYYPSAENAFENHFFYHEDIEYLCKSNDQPWCTSGNDLNDDLWKTILKDNLNNGYPIIYVAVDYETDGCESGCGHAWNLDGYNDDLFHMNWGWGGYGNGYFSLDDLNPEDDYNFNSDHEVLYNIYPQQATFELENISNIEMVGDMDELINIGETHYLNCEITNTSNATNAENITFTLKTDSNDIEILDDTYEMYSLDSQETTSSNSMFVIQIDSDSPVVQSIPMEVEISELDGSILDILEFDLDITLYQKGFPYQLVFNHTSSVQGHNPIVIDINRDNHKEIVFGSFNDDSESDISVINYDGTTFLNSTAFPFSEFEDTEYIKGSIASADLDNDGFLDFVVPGKEKKLYIIKNNSLDVVLNTDGLIISSVAIANLDDDLDFEIVFGEGGKDISSYNNKLHAVNYDGSSVSGYPIELDGKINYSAVVFDINADGLDELVVSNGNDIYLVNNGSENKIFECTSSISRYGAINNAITATNYNNKKLILFGCGVFLYGIDEDGLEVLAISLDGSELATEVTILKDDSYFYLLFGTKDDKMHLLKLDGSYVSGWPKILDSEPFSGSAYDLNNDDIVDIIWTDGTSLHLCISENSIGDCSNLVSIESDNIILGSATIEDIDNDDDVEIIFLTQSTLEIFDYKNISSNNSHWSMYRGNKRRTGFYNQYQVFGCPSSAACNYNDESNNECKNSGADCYNDGSCLFNDECNICGGDNSSCSDCAGVPNGDAELDSCEICIGGTTGLSLDEFYGINLEGEIQACGTCDCLSITDNAIPNTFKINNIYPNPFNPILNIEYSIPFNSFINIDIFNLRGKKIADLIERSHNAGHFNISWDASQFSSGIYFVKLGYNNQSIVRKIILIK